MKVRQVAIAVPAALIGLGLAYWLGMLGPREALREQQAQYTALTTEREALRERVATAEKSIAREQEHAAALQRALENARAEAADRAALAQQTDSLTTERDRLEARGKEQSARVDQMEATIARLRSEAEAASARTGTLESALEQRGQIVKRSAEEVAELTARVGGLEEQVRTLEARRDELEAFRRDAQSDIEALRSDNAAIAARADALAAESPKIAAERDALHEQLAASTAERDRLRDQVAKGSESLAQIEAAAAQREQQLRTDMDALGEQLAASTAERDRLRDQLASISENLDQAKGRAAELNSLYEKSLMEQSTLAQQDAAVREDLEKLRKAFEEAQAEVARLAGARGIYTVQGNDNLWRIAHFFYRDGLRWQDVFEANSFLISHPDLIYTGQVLIIPK